MQEAMLKKSWDVALKRAAGEKVLDDPKLLRKSIKRDRKAKQKSAEQWAERVRKQEDSQKEKQLKRFHNIAKKVRVLHRPQIARQVCRSR